MNITDVRVRKVAKEGKMKAVVSITIDDEFVVHDIKVIEGEKGLFIAMPSRKATDGEYRDIAHPINSGTREKIQTIILKQYEQAMAEAEAEIEKATKKASASQMVQQINFAFREIQRQFETVETALTECGKKEPEVAARLKNVVATTLSSMAGKVEKL